MKLFILAFLLIVSTVPDASAHQFEDGFVERTMSVVVRENIATVEYSVGLNAVTMQEIVEQWESPEKTSDSTSSAVEADREAETVVDGEHWVDEELFKKFKNLALAEIAKKIVIECDGSRIKIDSASLGVTPRHPFNVSVKFQFEIPESGLETTELKINDRNFAQNAGAVRYSLKTMGSTMLMKSNVAPILIRAERIEIDGKKAKDEPSKTAVLAKIAISK